MNRSLWTIVLTALVAVGAGAAELRDVSWKCKAGDCALSFVFDPAGGLPSYFQKYDASRQILKVAFATTGIKIPPGSWTIDGASKGLRALTLKQDVSSKGTPLLVFEWQVGSDIVGDKNPVELEKSGRFVIKLPTKNPTKDWILSVAAKAKPQAVRADVVAPLPPPAIPAPKTAKVKVEVAAPIVAPVIVPTVSESTFKTANLVPGIVEISWIRGFGMEQFSVQLQEDAPPTITRTDSSIVIPLKKNAKIGVLFAAVGSGLVRDVRVNKAALNCVELILNLKPASSQLLVHGTHVWLQAAVPTNPGLEVWNVDSKGSHHRLFDESVSDDELQSLDNFAQGISKAPISTSQTFQLKKGSRDLIVVEENCIMREAPSEVANSLVQLKFGDHLQSLDLTGLYYKVKYNEVTGYVNRRMVSYPDELSHVQTEKLLQLVNSQKAALASAKAAGIPEGGDSLSVDFEDPDADRITYSSLGRRDPFIELKGVVNEGINIDGVELVGIIWESEVPMVVLTDSRNPGVSYTLKEGDSILNGKVLKITQDEVMFLISEFGVSRRYTMTLPDKYGGKK